MVDTVFGAVSFSFCPECMHHLEGRLSPGLNFQENLKYYLSDSFSSYLSAFNKIIAKIDVKIKMTKKTYTKIL